MVRTRRGTQASPQPRDEQQSPTETERDGLVPQTSQRQTRSTGKADLNLMKRKQVPKEVLALLSDEPASTIRAKRRRLQHARQREDDQFSDDHVEEGLLEVVKTAIQGPTAPDAEGPGAQLQREASERPPTATAEDRERVEGSMNSERPPRVQQSIFEDDEDSLSSIESLEYPAPANGANDVEEGMFIDENEDEEAFPELPNMGEKDFVVRIKVGGLKGMLDEVGKVGWTGHGSKWEKNIDRDMNPKLETSQSHHTELCERLRQATSRLSRIFDEGSSYPDPKDGLDFLRERAEILEKTFEHMAKLVKKVHKKFANPESGEQLSGKALKQRRMLAEDMLRYGIPSVLIVLRDTFRLGANNLRAKTWGDFTSITLKYLMKETEWLQRLLKATVGELEARPFEPEFMTPEDELTGGDMTTRQRKSNSRTEFRKRLDIFHRGLVDAILELHESARAETRRKQEAETRQWRLAIFQKEEHVARNVERRKRKERKEQFLRQWQAMCASTQDLRSMEDPVKRKWDEAMEEDRLLLESAEALSSQASRQWRAMVASTHDLRDVPDPVAARWASRAQRSVHPLEQIEGDPFGDEVEQGQTQFEPEQVSVTAWPAWGADEDAVVFEALKYSKTLNIPRIAKTLNRDEHDVKDHIQELKEARARARATAEMAS